MNTVLITMKSIAKNYVANAKIKKMRYMKTTRISAHLGLSAFTTIVKV